MMLPFPVPPLAGPVAGQAVDATLAPNPETPQERLQVRHTRRAEPVSKGGGIPQGALVRYVAIMSLSG